MIAKNIAAAMPRLMLAWYMSVTLIGVPSIVFAEEAQEPKSIRMTCGRCPDGYATTGVTQAADICTGEDPTLVQCVPLGSNLLPICGSCPEGYKEIGRSSVPARCGSRDGGLLTQCQLHHMEHTSPDPSQGYKRCPPDCGTTGTPGEGALPPPPRYQPMPGAH